MTFADFFKTATGNKPYGYQCRLACGDAADSDDPVTLTSGSDCASRLISIPTGLGKTAAVILAWLWNRVALGNESWPRRLVYCLPMRTLVEQTRDEAGCWLKALAEKYPDNADLKWLAAHSPVILMGGEENDAARREWDIYPEKPAILVGTQDMLLSRALNRGYGMARARWPMHFGLLNNDCLWVMDETQLMDVGLATSAQLQAFRDEDGTRTPRPSRSWWMSATLQPNWMKSPETVSLLADMAGNILTTSSSDRQGSLWTGVSKSLVVKNAIDEKRLAAFAIEKSAGVETTLVIVNTVKRAVAVYDALVKDKQVKAEVDIHLVHSRFRPYDRKIWRNAFLRRDAQSDRPRIIVATQVVEAGVDISANILITDLAPWTSLVQRFGRAARYGGSAQVFVVDVEEKKAAPYDYAELEVARAELANIADVAIAAIEQHEAALTPERRRALYPYTPKFLLLRREVEELFDTSADLSGADLDISRFIRSGEENDCQLAWIDLQKGETPAADFQPLHEEICAVPIGEARNFLKSEQAKNAVWRWDYLDRAWRGINERDIYPGLLLLVRADAGGYSTERGFDPAIRNSVPCRPINASVSPDFAADAAEDDESLSETIQWQNIAEHGQRAEDILKSMNLAPPPLAALLGATALWHDLGKAHPAFQSIIRPDDTHPRGDIAKAPPSAWIKPVKYQAADNDPRPSFRHELASALALIDLLRQDAPHHDALLGPWTEYFQDAPLESGDVHSVIQRFLANLTADEFNLLVYLVAAHHGKVRASMQASPVDQEHPVAQAGGDMPIRGLLEGDNIPSVSLFMPDGALAPIPATRMTLEPAFLGLSERTGASWAERSAALLTQYGPFALAWLEAIIRAADGRASKRGIYGEE